MSIGENDQSIAQAEVHEHLRRQHLLARGRGSPDFTVTRACGAPSTG